MIPFIRIAEAHVGPLVLHPFGLLVAASVIVGSRLAVMRARATHTDVTELHSFITWMLIGGFVGGHVLDEFFYHPSEALRAPWSLLYLWAGLSSFGGFIGGIAGIALWRFFELRSVVDVGPVTLRWFKRRLNPRPVLPLCDLLMSVFPFAWALGRTGCAVVHDHPGARTTADTWLAVAYGQGPRESFGPITLIHGDTPRFDLGLLEMMFAVVLAACFALTWGRRLRTGTYLAVASLAYAPVRFVMDDLRLPDAEGGDLRYGGLTPAQWCCLALFAFGLACMLRCIRNAATVPCAPAPAPGRGGEVVTGGLPAIDDKNLRGMRPQLSDASEPRAGTPRRARYVSPHVRSERLPATDKRSALPGCPPVVTRISPRVTRDDEAT